MKRSALAVVLAAAFAAPAALSAQATQTQSITVNATVHSYVAWTKTADLTFAAGITPGTAASVAPSAGALLSLSYNQDLSVAAPAAVSITNAASGASMSVDLTCAQSAAAADPAPTAFVCATGQALTFSGTTANTRYFYVGGDITAANSTGRPAGSYTGTFNITASYTAQ